MSILHEPEKFLAKGGIPNRIEQDRILRTVEPRDYGMRRVALDRLCGFTRSDLNRQRIGFRCAVGVMDFHKPKASGVVRRRDRDLLADPYFAKSSRLRAKPSTSADVIGQNVALDLNALTICEQRTQFRARVDGWHNTLLRRMANLTLRLQYEPVTRMRTKR